VFDDTWQFDTTTRSWTMVRLTGNSPPARTGYAMAYDRVGDRVVLFGGFNGSAFFNDLWFLNR
jgi:N-acetylneuraminic acid mutarotase